jgi:hypothetical protein
MKNLRSHAGPFAERPFYKDDEIEQICLDALRSTGFLPDGPQPIRIERFITKRFGITPEYESLPEGVLGYTEFGSKGVRSIYVERTLVEEGTAVAERRVNTTLAHEAGHGLLHAHLFALAAPSPKLFGNDPDCSETKILCRDDTPGSGRSNRYDGRWWEFQANKAMGALLLPKLLVEQCVGLFVVSRGTFGRETLDSARRSEAIQLVAETFDVNPVVAKIRIASMYTDDDRQLTL